MKHLFVIALCFFSMFVVCATTAQAVECKKGDNGIIKSPEERAAEMKACEAVYDDYPPDIFDHLLFVNKIALFICGCLFIFGAYKLSTKKEMTKKEEVRASLFVYSPLLPILFFIIIKHIQTLM